jgi:cobalamin biosynthesis Mg chelatase CobN
LLHALCGRFVPPGLMGDPLRSPEIYPTGRNGFAFDPTRIPFADAVARGAALGEAMVARHVALHGRPPTRVALVLWGFETARSGGETIGQLLYLLGAEQKSERGWLPSFAPIPRERLGRPRVDVVLMCCGFFRDMFPTLLRDLDRLVSELALLPEPDEQNPIASQARRDGQQRPARIFGPAPGAYGTDLPELVSSSCWGDAAELGERFASAMAFAYGEGSHGVPASAELAPLLASTEVVSQVIDGEDYKIGDLDHYFEFLGGLARAVHNRSGEAPATLVGDTARAKPRLQTAERALTDGSITRLLNPRWIEGLLQHELHGAQKIADRVTNLLGLSATVGVPQGLWQQVFERYLDDAELFSRLCDNNPTAAGQVARRLAEADERGFWQPSPEARQTVRERYRTADDVAER